MRDKDNGRSKFSSWGRSDPRHVADEIKSRRLYNETRGTQFQSDTLVVRNKGVQAAPETASESAHNSSQSTMGLFGGSSSKGGGKSYASFFDRLMKDANSGASMNGQNGGQGLPGASSWVKGMSSSVPSEKRASIERHLKWMAKMENGQQHLNMASTAPVTQVSAQPIQPMAPIGQVVESIVPNSTGSKEPTLSASDAVKAALSQPGNMEVFNAIKTEIGSLLLYDLPPEVTSKLRQIGKQLDQLNSSVN